MHHTAADRGINYLVRDIMNDIRIKQETMIQ